MRLSEIVHDVRSAPMFGAGPPHEAYPSSNNNNNSQDASAALLPNHGSQQKREAAELATAIHMYCRFCNDVSIDSDLIGPSFQKMLVVSQKNITVRAAYAALFEQNQASEANNLRYIDWEHMVVLERNKIYSDAVSWVRVLTRYVEVVAHPKTDADMRALLREHPPLHHLDECMRSSKLLLLSTECDPPEAAPAAALAAATHNNADKAEQPRPWFTAMVHLYLLIGIQRIQTLNAVEQYFSITFNRDVHREAMLFFSLLANQQAHHDAHTKALVALMQRHVRIRTRLVQQELELLQLREKELEGLFHMKSMRALGGRPKLRSKLRTHNQASGSLFGMDQLSQWNSNIRFPNVFSMKQRKRLYFIMAQTHLDAEACMPILLRDHDLAATVLKYPVKQPEIEVIHECIMGCRIVSDPFPELHQFRATCFDGFAYEHKSQLRLNDLLHLFLSAYQHPSIWKSVWKLVFPVLSIQIIRDVEAFVARTPFPYAPIVSILFEQRFEFPGPKLAVAYTQQQRPTNQNNAATGNTTILSFSLPSPLLASPLSRDGGEETGPEGPQPHGVGGEDHDAAHGVGDAKPALLEGVQEDRRHAAPLAAHDAAEPGLVDGGVALRGLDVAHALAADLDRVEDQHPRLAVGLEEELGPEGGHGRALGAEHAGQGVRDIAHVTRRDVDNGVISPRADQQDLLRFTDEPSTETIWNTLFPPSAL